MVRSDLYVPTKGGWILSARGDTYRGLAADNNYVLAWTNTRDGARSMYYDPSQWILSTAGFYRVAQKIIWVRNGRVPAYNAYKWAWHSPSPDRNQYCYIQ